MAKRHWAAMAMALAVLIAAGLRLGWLNARPLHADEAVHAFRIGDLLTDGTFVYDPGDYHGPTLYWLTAAVAGLRGHRCVEELDAIDLRLPAALVGVAMVASVWMLRGALGTWAAVAGAWLLAMSACLTFYSAYAIPEIVLALAWMWVWIALLRVGRPGWRGTAWAAALGVAFGIGFATKATSLVNLAALLLAAVIARPIRLSVNRLIAAGAVAAPIALAVWLAFLSNGFQRIGAIADAFLAFGAGIGRGTGASATADWHVHPWWFQLRAFAADPAAVVALVLAVVGLIRRGQEAHPTDGTGATGFSEARGAQLGLLVYAAAIAIVQSAIPYKTPWNAIQFVWPICLAGGVGLACVATWLLSPRGSHRVGRAGLTAGLAGVLVASGVGAVLLRTHPQSAWSARHPFVYAHTDPAAVAFTERFDVLRQQWATRSDVYVVAPNHDYWPLPWYWRRRQDVGYADRLPNSWPTMLILHPDSASELADRLAAAPPGEVPLYVPAGQFALRPGLDMTILVRYEGSTP